jgi:hypothetical protein
MSHRDRAADGRAQNRRPRDELGRPLAYGATGFPTISDHLKLSPTATLRLADELLKASRPFHAHEVLEIQWKRCPNAERKLWQGLAQIAVALTHSARGNPAGAQSVLQRASANLQGYRGKIPSGLDLTALMQWSDRALADVPGKSHNPESPWQVAPDLVPTMPLE